MVTGQTFDEVVRVLAATQWLHFGAFSGCHCSEIQCIETQCSFTARQALIRKVIGKTDTISSRPKDQNSNAMFRYFINTALDAILRNFDPLISA